jgi:glycosyltransferase involved in cell wall biosynthesis
LGVETVLLTRPATEAGAFPGEVVTVPYATVAAGGHGRVLDRSLNYPGFALRLGARTAELVRAGRVDVVHAQGLTALGYARLRRREAALRAPLLMNPQGMEEHKTRGLKRVLLGRVRRLSREAAALSDRVIATDETTRGEVVRHLGVAPERIVVLPNGIDDDQIQRATPPDPAAVVAQIAPALAGATPLLLSVGRLEAYKGFGDTLEALAGLHSRGALPAAWAWAVVGEGPEAKPLQRRLTPELRPHVHLLGRVTEERLHALYARAHLFVHATHYEGSSLVTLEAMAHGLPVVATRAGGIPDKVQDGETGLLVSPGDVDALGRALAAVVSAPERRQAMGCAGRKRALALFGWPVLARRTLAVYEALLREASR